MKNEPIPSVTALMSAGRLPLDVMKEINRLAEEFSLEVYLTNAQNIRLMGIPEGQVDTVQRCLTDLGVQLKGPGKFPLPRVCIGTGHCKLGIIDTWALSEKITSKFMDREKTKAKFKIAVSGCILCCSNAKTTDLGIVATREGLEFYVGGKGGPYPRIGRRIGKKLNDDEVLEMMSLLVDFHDAKTEKKQRFTKLIDLEDFPFPEV
ncbi:nitrite reductase [Desulfopila sp. IMCC35008]|uniref:nitrite reductase n=1 Tax=Desulfopila sp. IMCC35008 TaxID=2653858 RepID=UPI0013D28F38|nr:nitrite reductase [Desulfopila sp. IMCC35008]